MIENFSEYTKLAQKTENLDFKKIEGNLTHDCIRLLHASMGICTEIGEAILANRSHDNVNLKEEMGDILWYLAVIQNVTGVELEKTEYFKIGKPRRTTNEVIEELTVNSSELLDICKKVTFYSKPFTNELRNHFLILSVEIYKNVLVVIKNERGDARSIMETNIAKLKKRYGDKFTEESALNRDLAREREILENDGK